MHEQQGESDEDCEVYFLKPVNEYNIVDKIKEANKELFADAALGAVDADGVVETETVIQTSIATTTTTTTTIRKVTFAPNLEDYEPENSERLLQTEPSPDEIKRKLKVDVEKFPTINEEDQTAQQTLEDEPCTTTDPDINDAPVSIQAQIDEVDSLTAAQQTDETIKTTVATTEEDDVDEICEEIIVMEMDGITTSTMTTITTAATTLNDSRLLTDDSLTAQQQRRIMLKQPTFDYDEQDNKSLTNLLTVSDGEDEESGRATFGNLDEYDDDDAGIFVGIDEFDVEDDDDDKLSLIVASYLPEDFERITTVTPSPPNEVAGAGSAKTSGSKNCSYFRRNNGNSSNSTSAKTSLSSSLGRRFQLRRKTHSSNSIGALCGGGNNNNGNTSDLKLNYKTCCEYRNCIQGKLPKYTGYLSEYGLSRDQLQQREQKLQKKQRFVLEQTLKANEQEMRKMQDNERAFTTWLRNKMRFPINKTRNMFDVKIGIGRKISVPVPDPSSPSKTGNNNGNRGDSLGCASGQITLKTN